MVLHDPHSPGVESLVHQPAAGEGASVILDGGHLREDRGVPAAPPGHVGRGVAAMDHAFEADGVANLKKYIAFFN